MCVNADPISIYGGTYVSSAATPAGWTFYFDQNQFQNITSITGTDTHSSNTTAGSYSPVTGSIHYDSPSSTGSQSGYFSINAGIIRDFGYTDSISLNVSSTNGTTYSHLDFNLYSAYGITDCDPSKYYEVIPFIKPTSITGASINGYEVEVINLNSRFTDSWSNHILFKGSDIVSYSREYNGDLPVLLFHVSGTAMNPTSSTGTLQAEFGYYLFEVTKDIYDSNVGESVHDTGAQTGINQGNQIAQDTNNTEHDTNNKITSFFNSFFDNLIGVFVPESGFFSSWFNDLNDFFAFKLGFLYAPFDFIISFFNGVLNTVGTQSHGFTIPALSWDGMEFCPEVNFSFDMFADQFPQLQEAVYFFSDVVIILALMRGIRSKLDLVMGVHEE